MTRRRLASSCRGYERAMSGQPPQRSACSQCIVQSSDDRIVSWLGASGVTTMLLPKLSRHVGVVVLMDPPALDLALELAAVLPRVARDTSVSVEQRGGADLAMERYAAGDSAAFAQVYDALAPRLFAYLFRQTRERSRAEDLLQQTMLHIHRARDRFIPGAQVTPWAFAIARRLLVDSTRRGRREILGDGTVVDTGVASTPRADDMVQASQVAVRIELVLAGLP